jgi:hypothetical protein
MEEATLIFNYRPTSPQDRRIEERIDLDICSIYIRPGPDDEIYDLSVSIQGIASIRNCRFNTIGGNITTPERINKFMARGFFPGRVEIEGAMWPNYPGHEDVVNHDEIYHALEDVPRCDLILSAETDGGRIYVPVAYEEISQLVPKIKDEVPMNSIVFFVWGIDLKTGGPASSRKFTWEWVQDFSSKYKLLQG